MTEAAPAPTATAGIPTPTPSVVRQPRLIREDGSVIDLAEGSSVVGREPGLAISLVGETTVSRSHAEVVRSGDKIVVRDLGSTNGTFVNGVQVAGEAELHPGDLVQFGSVRTRLEG